MKKIILLFVLTLGLITAKAQQPAGNDGPKIQFESEIVNFGTVQQDADGNREFRFKNVGNAPLVITDVKSSCGCLVASGPKEPIAPGKSGVIKTVYDTKRVGRFEKTITVVSNDSQRPSLVLKIKGEVQAPK